jgi:hypothetical protein
LIFLPIISQVWKFSIYFLSLSFLFFSFSFFFFLFHFLSHGLPLLQSWPIFPPGPAHPTAQFPLSSSSGVNRSQDEALSPNSKPTRNQNRILKRNLKDVVLKFKDLFVLKFDLNLQNHSFLIPCFYF